MKREVGRIKLNPHKKANVVHANKAHAPLRYSDNK